MSRLVGLAGWLAHNHPTVVGMVVGVAALALGVAVETVQWLRGGCAS